MVFDTVESTNCGSLANVGKKEGFALLWRENENNKPPEEFEIIDKEECRGV